MITFLATVAYVPGVPGGLTVLRWAILAAGAACAVLALSPRRPNPGEWAGLLFLAYVAASIGWSVSPWTTTGALLHYLALGALFAYAARTDLGRWWDGYVWGMAVSGAVALAQTFGWLVYAEGHGQNAVSGLFENKNLLAECAAVAVVVAFYRRQWLALPFVLFAALEPASRTVWLALGLWGGVELVRRSRDGVLLWLALPALLSPLVIWGYFDAERLGRLVSLNSRLAMYQLELHNLRWFGWGLGTFGEILPMYRDGHDDWLQYVFELGLGAAPLFYALAWGWRAKWRGEHGVLLVLGADALFNFPCQQPVTLLALALAAGGLCGARARERGLAPRGDRAGDYGAVEGGYRYAATYLRSPRPRGLGLPARPRPAVGPDDV